MEKHDELTYAIEALLFASERPLTITQIKEAFSAIMPANPSQSSDMTSRRMTGASSGGEEKIDEGDIRKSLHALKLDYELGRRGFRLFEIAGGYQIVTDSRFEAPLKRFFQERIKKHLSQATLETLSIIAYRQPVTRADIEFVRGVNVDGAIRTLMEKGLIKITGKKEAPGRPLLYGTTPLFLEHFCLSSIQDLPPLAQYTEKDIDEDLLPPEMKRQEAREKREEEREETQNERR